METKPSAFKSALIPGLMIGLASVVISLIGSLLFDDLKSQQYLGYFTWIVVILLLIYYVINYRKNVMEDNMTYGQGFTYLFFVNIINSIIVSIYGYLNMTIIDPGFMDKVKEQTYTELAKNPDLTEAQIEQAIEMQSKFMSPGIMIVWAIVGSIIFGVIISLIIAAFVKKENKQFATDTLD